MGWGDCVRLALIYIPRRLPDAARFHTTYRWANQRIPRLVYLCGSTSMSGYGNFDERSGSCADAAPLGTRSAITPVLFGNRATGVVATLIRESHGTCSQSVLNRVGAVRQRAETRRTVRCARRRTSVRSARHKVGSRPRWSTPFSIGIQTNGQNISRHHLDMLFSQSAGIFGAPSVLNTRLAWNTSTSISSDVLRPR